eukprot:Platyproteum_vivax@DN1298_c0_g1_i1.p1
MPFDLNRISLPNLLNKPNLLNIPLKLWIQFPLFQKTRLSFASDTAKNENYAAKKRVLREPWKPEDSDCCGGGCDPCIWDTYYEALAKYEKARSKHEVENSDKSSDN